MKRNLRDAALFFLIMFMCCVGCVGPGLTSVKAPWVYVDPAVPMPAAQRGLTMWRDAVGIDWVITTERAKAAVTIVAVTDGCAEPGHRYDGYDDDGSTQAAICLGNFDTARAVDVLPIVIAHELGHVMHLGHIPDAEPALMNRGPQGGPTEADIRAWHAVWGGAN